LAVSADDLSTPLGQSKKPKPGRAMSLAVPYGALALVSSFVVLVAGWAMTANDPFGGEPMVLTTVDLAAANATRKDDEITIVRPPAAPGSPTPIGNPPNRRDRPTEATPAAATTPAATTPANGKTITIIDGSSGKREQIVIPDAREPASSEPKASDLKASDPKLTEPSRHGPLPRVAADGTRPAEAYARPVKPIAGRPDAPRVAIVIGGLGIGKAATEDALAKLPGAVTLAFAPYADALERLVARARNDGHEVLLQIPMEPFDYPDNDPGPRTLLVELDTGQNVDRLQWLLSRTQGYVGITNYMGGRFTASETALSPVLKEASGRGLIYLDDGSSQRSLASQVAGATNLAFAKADLTIDAVPAPNDIDRALGRLEAMARERGLAVGSAGALPGVIERIARWAKAAEGRGILLVPISAAAKRPLDDRRTSENRGGADGRQRAESH
jgi:uncharacterized protein